jgi:hypothetical protein
MTDTEQLREYIERLKILAHLEWGDSLEEYIVARERDFIAQQQVLLDLTNALKRADAAEAENVSLRHILESWQLEKKGQRLRELEASNALLQAEIELVRDTSDEWERKSKNNGAAAMIGLEHSEQLQAKVKTLQASNARLQVAIKAAPLHVEEIGMLDKIDELEAENARLREALVDMLRLIDEHGSPVMKAHATRVMKARAALLATVK